MSQVEVGSEKRPFLGLTDLPLYGRSAGWLKSCQNFRVMPGGYLEARGGVDELRPSNGSGQTAISTGFYTGAHEHTMSDGYLFTATNGGIHYSDNLAQRGEFVIFASGAQADDAFYIFADRPFGRVAFHLTGGTFGVNDPVVSYEYPTTSDWVGYSSLTTTSTPDFEATGDQILEFAQPSDWVKSVRNGIYGYGVRIRLSTINDGVTAGIRQGGQKVYCDWTGARQIYVAGADPAISAAHGSLKYVYYTTASTISWNAISSSLFSGPNVRTRFASYKNLLFMVNGKEQKRWDGNTLDDIGFDAPTSSDTDDKDVTVAGGLTGLFKYAVTYGYGPGGDWGESNELQYADTGGVLLANKAATYTLNLTNIDSTVERIYVYRTTDLTSVPDSAIGAFPMFRIQTLERGATGQFPASFTDTTLAFPFPPVELDITVNTPPQGCRFITVHKNRLFLAGNAQFPGRQWWSKPFEMDSFNTDEDFADFTRSTGGLMTGQIEFGDQVVSFTEDRMFGTSNVDQDQPSIYEIAHIGCIAPDSLKAAFGYLAWLSRNGVYVWDGQSPPVRVSDQMSNAFGKMTLELHGLARAEIHDRMYTVYLPTSNLTYRYDLVTKSWGSVVYADTAKKWAPMAVVTAPLGHADEGVRHPLIAQTANAGAADDFKIYLGEYTTSDDGSDFTCLADVHFGPPGRTEVTLDHVYTYYKTDAGWGTPTLSFSSLSPIGDFTGTLKNHTPDGATDYTRLNSTPVEGTLGTGDLVVRFEATTTGSGSAGLQRLLSVGIEGSFPEAQWGK